MASASLWWKKPAARFRVILNWHPERGNCLTAAEARFEERIGTGLNAGLSAEVLTVHFSVYIESREWRIHGENRQVQDSRPACKVKKNISADSWKI
jgi:hypothetical protein